LSLIWASQLPWDLAAIADFLCVEVAVFWLAVKKCSVVEYPEIGLANWNS
jgi:hypothetical protein